MTPICPSVQDRQDFRAHVEVDLGELHYESRGQFAHRCRLCRFCEDGRRRRGGDARYWSLVSYTPRRLQVVPSTVKDERIPFTPTTCMLLEIQDMKHTSPAIVSHGGLYFIYEADVGL